MHKFKQGFTLTEAVITMTVIGVVSALLLPMANKFRPDPVKVKYIQTYDAITYVANELANNSILFPANYINPANQSDVYNVSNDPFWGRGKEFCENFIQGVNAPQGTSCDADGTKFESNFTSNNGTSWNITTESITNNTTGIGKFLTTVDVVFNNSPESFTFYILPDGSTMIGDSLGDYYKRTRSSWRISEPNLEVQEIAPPSGEMDIKEENPGKFQEKQDNEPQQAPEKKEEAEIDWNFKFEHTVTGIYLGRRWQGGFEQRGYVPITPTYCDTLGDVYELLRSTVMGLEGYGDVYASLYGKHAKLTTSYTYSEYRGLSRLDHIEIETTEGVIQSPQARPF